MYCHQITNIKLISLRQTVIKLIILIGELNTIMLEKTILTVIFILLLFISYYVLMGPTDLRSHFFPATLISTPQSSSSPPCNDTPITPLRVFMYDLPRRFNVGMFNHSADETPVTPRTLPSWPNTSGSERQHSVEYWIMASLLLPSPGDDHGDDDDNGREAVRVFDPSTADVFLVPFFSSMSYNRHGHNMTDPHTIDLALQEEIMDFLRQSQHWQTSQGRDHVIPLHHPNAFRFLRDQLNASILIVADFARYPKSVANLRKDVVAPYVHVVDSFDDNLADPSSSRPTLLFFRGGTIRKSEGIVRAQLEKILTGYDDVRYERGYPSSQTIKEASEGMRSSKFCLHPAGDTFSSCRLFDAIVSHCVPVIVSDHIELPFEDDIDYTKFSIFFSVKEALEPDYMIKTLRQISKERWVEMWTHLKTISRHYEYQRPTKNEDAVNMIWRQVRRKVPAAKLAVHRNSRLKIADWWNKRR